jgi:alanine racemase
MLKTWIEINTAAVKNNVKIIRRLLNSKTKLWAVVKSNAYGHGLSLFSKIADKNGVDGFCVDSVVEGLKLREEGIKKHILVLGPTFKNLFRAAAENKITITISNLEGLQELAKSKYKPDFHLKIDTGMHRQGFYVEELFKVLQRIMNQELGIKNSLTGVYTHFASAKDVNYPTFTEEQFKEFQKATRILEKAGFKNLVKHAAATGGTLVNQKYHLDAVRIGIGLYGLYPSPELEMQMPKLGLKPVLSWYATISEVKNLKPGDYIGYDLAERIQKNAKMAVIPIGYWHGFPRALSGIGEVLIRGKRARVLGRVSMDMIVVDITGIDCKRGDKATLIISAYETAKKLGASYYELLTRINPLIERIAR